MTELFKYIG